MKNKKFIVEFKDINASMISLVGGKGANLGELANTGFPVPEGFCITTAAWDIFLESVSDPMNNFPGKLELFSRQDLNDSTSLKQIRAISAKYRELLLQSPIPAAVPKALEEVFVKTGADAYYAVRSSATAEDLPGFSFAGQQDTFLNVHGLDTLLVSVRKCWASLFTDRAVLYRIQNGFSHKAVKLAVVVQRMVSSETSGILFTADPLSGNRNIITIDAGFGLGEALVSGLIDPDNYMVNKQDISVLSADVKVKKFAIYPDKENGTISMKLDKEKACSRVLSDSQIKELCRLALKVEEHYKIPQDIEWGWEKNHFFLLQSRPVTTLFPLPESPRGRKDHRIYISLGHVQVMTSPISPMGRSLIKLFLPFGRPDNPGEYNPFITEAGERIYTDITPLLTRKFFRKRYPSILEGIDPLLGRGVQEALSMPDVLESIKKQEKKISLRPLVKIIRKIMVQAVKAYFTADPRKHAEKITSGFEESVSSLEDHCRNVPSQYEKLLLLRSYAENYVEKAFPLLGAIFPALVSWKSINKYMKQWASGKDLDESLQAIERGLVGNITTGMDLETGDLADLLSDNPLLVDFFTSRPLNTETIESGRKIEGSRLFYTHLDSFMKRFGMRGTGEFDIRTKRWKDNPGAFVTMLLSQISREEKGSHRHHFEELTSKAESAVSFLTRKARESAPGFTGIRRERRIKKLLSLYRGYMPLREHGKYFLMRLYDIIREQILKVADDFVLKSIVPGREAIWFLEYNELLDLVLTLEHAGSLSNGEKVLLNKKISERKERFEMSGVLDPPRVILGSGIVPRPSYSREGIPPNAFIGAGVSAGIVEGKAKVVLDPQKQSLLPGEILIAPFTDPAWTPLFINAAAVVIEVGGKMTHGSVIAREYGIPAVVSIPGATNKIITGQKIRVNGSEGYVQLLDE